MLSQVPSWEAGTPMQKTITCTIYYHTIYQVVQVKTLRFFLTH